MKLKGRLAELAHCYSDEAVVWDVGCDHGYLGLSFLDEPMVKEVHLVDPSHDVIKELLNNKQLDSYITKRKLFIHHLTGQEVILSSRENKIFIAGMGGKEIIAILKSFEQQAHLHFNCVVSPHKNILELRDYLKDSHFRLRNEFLIKDGGRFYQVMGLDFSLENTKVSPYGERLWNSPYAPDYRDYLLNVYGPHQEPKDQAYYKFLKSLSF